MPCPHRKKTIRVLMGEVGPDTTAKVLEHCRVCGECRQAFDFGAATITRSTATARAEPAGALASSERHAGPAASSGAWRNPVRRNRRTLIVFGVAAVACLLAGVGRGKAGEPPSLEAPAEALWRRMLGEGTPVVQSPAGGFEGRPRVVTALVPPGSGRFGVSVLDQDGRSVFFREEKPGERGCFVEEVEIAAPGGSFKAGRLLLPFPEEEALALPPGRPFGVVITVGGGHASPASVFQVAGGAAGFQDARKDER
jgi:hypothetical protein